MANREFFFFYAPTWDYPPDGPIKLGNVITSVKKPHRPLFCSAPPTDSNVFSTEKRSVHYTVEKSKGGKFSVLTRFLDILGLGIDIGAQIDNNLKESFFFKTLETIQFIPTKSYIQATIEDETVRCYLHASRYRKPIYIITGLKIVTGAEANRLKSRTISGTLAVGVGGMPAADSPGLEPRASNKAEIKWQSCGEFVFAFRVSKIFVSEVEDHIREEEYRQGALLDNKTEKARLPELVILKIEESTPESEGFDSEELVEDNQVVTCAIPRDEESDD